MATQGGPPGVSARAILQRLESLERAGVRQLGRSRPLGPTTHSVEPRPPQSAAGGPPLISAVGTTIHSAGRSLFDVPAPVGDTLEIIARDVAACRACDELARTRTQTVFGV